ncbi:MAG: hypothetical protein AMJ90_01440 [candidate division Zixibacteria bacterium SM23_73_2]|nr:MAG: hypothetical protein AMJ90_01440 [candidate division Zixibacteria bacterium SM23_73_2]
MKYCWDVMAGYPYPASISVKGGGTLDQLSGWTPEGQEGTLFLPHRDCFSRQRRDHNDILGSVFARNEVTKQSRYLPYEDCFASLATTSDWTSIFWKAFAFHYIFKLH